MDTQQSFPVSLAEMLSLVDLLRQTANTQGGNQFLPRTRSGISVPPVRALRIAQATNNVSGTQFVLTWESAEDPNVAAYNIFVSGLSNSAAGSSSFVGGAKDSPAVIQVNEAVPNTKVTFTVQTVLKSGHVSDLEQSPSVTGVVGSSSNTAGETNFAGVSVTSATAGALTLPSNPAGFIKVKVDGNSKRVPYYNP